MRERRRSLLDRLPFAAALVLLCALAFQRAPFHVDDAFITFRYAGNLVEHHSLAFNPGERPVEGFSSPLWLLMLAAGAALWGKSALPHVAFALGLLGAGVALALMQRLTRVPVAEGGETPRVGRLVADGLPLLWFAVLPPFVRYATTGLEHPWFLVCVLGVAAFCAGRAPLGWGVAFAALAPWFRPEGVWVVVASLVQRVATGTGGVRAIARDRAVWSIALAAGASQALLSLIRWLVFEDFVPNTYWAKAEQPMTGLEYLRDVFSTGWGAGVAATALLGLLLGLRTHRGYAAAGVAWLAATCSKAGDWMPDGRLALPGLSLLVAAASGALTPARPAAARGWRFGTVRSLALLALALATTAAGAHARLSLEGDRSNVRSLGHEQRVLARWLLAAGVRSVALVDIGKLGFMGDQQLTDLVGLTDRVIARSHGGHLHKDIDLGYVFDVRQPDVIVLRLWEEPTAEMLASSPGPNFPVAGGIEGRLFRDPRLDRDYRLLFAQLPYRRVIPYYGRLVYARKAFEPAIESPSRVTYIEELQE